MLLMVGIGSGVCAGLLGIGGGLVFLPLAKLYYIDYLGYPQDFLIILIATPSAIIVANGLSATLQHYRKKNVDLTLLPYFAVACFVGSRLGVMLVDNLPVLVVRFILAGFLLASAIRMFWRLDGREVDEPLRRGQRLQIGGFSFGISTLLSMLGLGGGALMTPVLNTLYSQPMKKAIGTASLFTVTVSSTACLYYLLDSGVDSPTDHLMVGYVDLEIAALVATGGIAGAWLGAKILQRSPVRTIRKSFAVLLILGAAKMVL